MIDLEIQAFYNSVKDPSWPDITDYFGYASLPQHIKDECVQLHGFQKRKDIICDAEYWQNITTDVCVYKNLAYVPIPKCAYAYYTTLFTNMGWERKNISTVDMESTKFFGLVMDPLTRWIKGITQWLVFSYTSEDILQSPTNPWVDVYGTTDWGQLKFDLKNKYLKNIIGSINVGDTHSLSYSTMLGPLLNQTNWIPMGKLSDNELKISMMDFFKMHGHNITLPLDDQRLHQSTDDQLEIFNLIKNEVHKDQEQRCNFYKLYGNDLKFFYNLLDTFSPDWQHLKVKHQTQTTDATGR